MTLLSTGKTNTAGADGASLATDRGAGAGDAEANRGRTAGSGAGPAGERGQAAGREALPLGVHGAEVLDHPVGQLAAGSRPAAAGMARGGTESHRSRRDDVLALSERSGGREQNRCIVQRTQRHIC
jgi:hypothetical protein